MPADRTRQLACPIDKNAGIAETAFYGFDTYDNI